MPTIIPSQQNLPLEWPEPMVSLPEDTQVEAITALSEMILQMWKKDTPLEDKTDE